MTGEVTGELRAPGAERSDNGEFELQVNEEFLGFSHITPAGTDAVGNPLVNVHWEDGHTVYGVLDDVPVFIIRDAAGSAPSVTLPLERADHIQKLHLEHHESGSFFTPYINKDYTTQPVTLLMLMQHLTEQLSHQVLAGEWSRRTVEFSSGDMPGREGVVTLDELKELGVISKTIYDRFLRLQPKIIHLNINANIDEKRRGVTQINEELEEAGESPLSVRLVREHEGGVVVPHVKMIPLPTSRMMVELGTDKFARREAYIHTIAPGRRMPRHPIPRLYDDGKDVGALHAAAEQWSTCAHVEAPPEDSPFFQRTLALLRTPALYQNFLYTQTRSSLKAANRLQSDLVEQASAQAQREVVRMTRLLLGLSKDEVANLFHLGVPALEAEKAGIPIEDVWRLKAEWGAYVEDVANFNASEVFGPEVVDEKLTVKQYLVERYAREKSATLEYLSRGVALWAVTMFRRGQLRQRWTAMIEELESRSEDACLLDALEKWTASPTSMADRAHDGRGYNSGLIHFFEYRGAPHKRKRFHSIDEEFSVDGFIAFTNRLAEVLERRMKPVDGEQVFIASDQEGNQRIYILLPGPKGEIIVAFKKAGDEEPKLAAMFAEVTQKAFERMIDDVLAGNDRGQINRLGGGVELVFRTPKPSGDRSP